MVKAAHCHSMLAFARPFSFGASDDFSMEAFIPLHKPKNYFLVETAEAVEQNDVSAIVNQC